MTQEESAAPVASSRRIQYCRRFCPSGLQIRPVEKIGEGIHERFIITVANFAEKMKAKFEAVKPGV